MKLYLTNSNKHNAYNIWNPGGIPYVSWKNNINNKTIIVPKNVKNDLPNNIKECTNNCQFKANPIKHYRKHYVNLNNNTTGFSNESYIRSLDKPGGTITTTTDCNNFYQKGYDYIINLNNITCTDTKLENSNGNCFIIKSATTVINNDYCSSNKELLRKKCKTFNQNLPSSRLNIDCSINNCNTTFIPSNKKYQVQGPITSSARIAAIKYCAQDVDSRRCYLPTTDYNKYGTTSHNKLSISNTYNNLAITPGCISCRSGNLGNKSKKYSNIRILK